MHPIEFYWLLNAKKKVAAASKRVGPFTEAQAAQIYDEEYGSGKAE